MHCSSTQLQGPSLYVRYCTARKAKDPAEGYQTLSLSGKKMSKNSIQCMTNETQWKSTIVEPSSPARESRFMIILPILYASFFSSRRGMRMTWEIATKKCARCNTTKIYFVQISTGRSCDLDFWWREAVRHVPPLSNSFVYGDFFSLVIKETITLIFGYRCM